MTHTIPSTCKWLSHLGLCSNSSKCSSEVPSLQKLCLTTSDGTDPSFLTFFFPLLDTAYVRPRPPPAPPASTRAPLPLRPPTSGYQEFPEGWPLSDSLAPSTGAEHHATAIAVTAQHPKLCSSQPSCPPFHSQTPFRPSYSQGRAFLQTQQNFSATIPNHVVIPT